MKMFKFAESGNKVELALERSININGLISKTGQTLVFHKAVSITSSVDINILPHVDYFYNVHDKNDNEALKIKMDVLGLNHVNMLYALHDSTLLDKTGSLDKNDLNLYPIKYSDSTMYAYITPPIAEFLNALRRWDSNSSNIHNRQYITADVINTIHNYIRIAPVAEEYKTIVNKIPNVLHGKFGLIGINLFLQVTDSYMPHCGFVYCNNTLYCANTAIFKSNQHPSNKIAYIIPAKSVSHYYPKTWVHDSDLDIMLPYDYAYENRLSDIYINESSETMTLDNNDLAYDQRVGYYDADTKCIIDDELFDIEDCTMLENGNWCHNDDVRYIENKNEYHHKDDCVQLHNGDYALSDDTVYLRGEYYLNDDYDHIGDCEDCNETCLNDDMYYHEAREVHLCQNCHEESKDDLYRMCYDTNVLHEKGFGVTNHYINKKPVYVGLELETYVRDGKEDSVNDFSHSCEYAVPTKDGSLSDSQGCEFIFRPEGLQQQKDNVTDLINSISDNLRNKTLSNYDDDYGLHVHVSSHFLGFASKLKIQKFVNLHCKKFQKYIGKRDETNYQSPRGMNDSFNELCYDRYSMVNVNPKDTIEFRFPAGLVNANHINLNLESALAVTMFCKFGLSTVILKNNPNEAWSLFVKFVYSNSDKYPLLKDTMDRITIDSVNNEFTQLAECA